jgi:hypothetical protein
MAMGQMSGPIASSTMRTSTWKPISSQVIRILLLWLVTTALLPFAFLELPQVSANPSSVRAVAPELYFGVVYPDAPNIPSLNSHETQIGKHVSMVLWYQPWSENGQMQPFPTVQMEAVREHGSIPMLAWAPDASPGPLDQPAYSLAKIAGGAWDTYLRQYASEAKAWGHPFFLRFASEMNGGWISWSESHSGNSAGQFVRAWRHVHDVFTSVGAKNVTWVWCPNNEDPYTTPLEELYPGNAYVDWAGIDGYNFSIDLNGAPWRSFSTIFSATYQDILRLVSPTMPIMIGETGSVEDGGSKADWITDALTTQLPTNYPRIKAFVWFDETDSNLNLSYNTSPSSMAALQKAVAATTYQPNRYSTLDQSPIPAPEKVVLPPPTPAPKPGVSVSYLSGPSPGTIQVIDTRNRPIPGATLVYQQGYITTANSSGVSRPPSRDLGQVLNFIVVGDVVFHTRLSLDLHLGYQIQINPVTAQVTQITVHDLVNLWPLVIQFALLVPLVTIALTPLFRRAARGKRGRQSIEQARTHPILTRFGP